MPLQVRVGALGDRASKSYFGAKCSTNGLRWSAIHVEFALALARGRPLVNVMLSGNLNEYGSIVSVNPKQGFELSGELLRAIGEIEAVRGHPCISYLGNVVNGDGTAGIDPTDDLPFHELVASVPSSERKVDVLVSTNGGSARARVAPHHPH